MPDFVNSRVVGGRQQIRTQISLHANGELVLYPYAYTTANVPGDMTTTDRRHVRRRWRRAMAATNGYTVRQSGDWYISDGDADDWMYGTPADLLVHGRGVPAGGQHRASAATTRPTR